MNEAMSAKARDYIWSRINEAARCVVLIHGWEAFDAEVKNNDKFEQVYIEAKRIQ